MRKFYLQRPLAGTRASPKDFKNQPGAIKYLDVPGFLQIALLHRGQVRIDDDDFRLFRFGKLCDLIHLAGAQDIAGIDDDSFAPIKAVLFDAGEEEDLPLLNRVQAGILLEVMKDMFYQCFVRRGKLTRALKVRRFFVQEANGDLASSA